MFHDIILGKMNINNGKKYTDLTYLRSVTKGNMNFEQKMLNTFIHQSAGDVQKLKQALIMRDWSVIQLVAHKMKPSLQFVGLQSLQADMHTLETIAKQEDDLDKTTELISNISTVIALAIEEIKEELLLFE